MRIVTDHLAETRKTFTTWLAVLLFAAASASAQQAAGAASTASADTVTAPIAPPPTGPYRAGEIAAQGASLRRLVETLPDTDDLRLKTTESVAELDGLSQRMAEERQAAEGYLLTELPVRILADLRLNWRRLEVGLEHDRSALANRLLTLEDFKAQLDGMRRRWQATRTRADTDNLPVATRTGIVENLTLIASTEADLRRQRDTLLEAQARVDALQEMSRRMEARLTAAIEEQTTRILDLRSAPLWQALAAAPAGSSLLDGTRTLLAAHVDLLAPQRHVSASSLLLRALLLGGFLVAAFRMRRSVRRLLAGGDESVQPALLIMERPISTALLVFLMLIILVDTTLPRVLVEALAVVAIIPLLRLIPRLTGPRLRGWIYVLALLYLVVRIIGITPAGDLFSRLLVISLATVALIAGLGFRRQLRASTPRTARRRADILELADLRRGPIPGAVDLGLVLLLSALVLEVIGISGLAQLLTRGVLVSLQVAVLLTVLVTVLRSILAIALASRAASRSRIVVRHRDELMAGFGRFLDVATMLLWLVAVLSLFALWSPAWTMIRAILFTPLRIRDLAISLADIAAFVLAIWLSFVISRWLRALLDEEFLPRLPLPRGVPNTLLRLTHYVVLFIGFMFAVNLAGLDLDRFTLLAGAFGVGIGFGLQNVVNNFISGLILLFERPVQMGDRVQVGAMLGTIERIGIRASVVRTFEGAEVIVPNGQLISDVVTNFTLTDKTRRIEILLGVAYGTDPQRVIDLLDRVIRQHPDVISDPEPVVLFMAFGESSLDFSVRVWTSNFDEFLRIGSEVRVAIVAALDEAGITIPFPQRDVHLYGTLPGGNPSAPSPDDRDGLID